MTVDQIPFQSLTTPAGIAAVGVAIRQVVEVSKQTFFPWLDDGNERKAAFVLAALVYLAWLVAYGKDLPTDGMVALAAFWTAATTSIGVNETVDAAKGAVAKNVQAAAPDQAGASAPVATAASSAGAVDDSVNRSAPLEAGPTADMHEVAGDVTVRDDLPPDPALAGAG